MSRVGLLFITNAEVCKVLQHLKTLVVFLTHVKLASATAGGLYLIPLVTKCLDPCINRYPPMEAYNSKKTSVDVLNKCCITVFNICATKLFKYMVSLSINFTRNLQKGIVLMHAVDICRQVHQKNSHNQTELASAQISIQILCRTLILCISTIIFEKNSISRQNIGTINSPLDSKVLFSFEAILERMCSTL